LFERIHSSIYEHWIAKDILAYIKIACGQMKRSHFYRIMNRPLRYLKREAFSDENVDYSEVLEYYEGKKYMQEKVEEFIEDMEFISGQNPFGAINYIRRGIGYDEYLEKYAKEKNINETQLFKVIDDIQKRAASFLELETFLEHVKMCQEKKLENKVSEGVGIFTLHGSKGLEYSVVFIPNINEGNIPYSKAVSAQEKEEERRLFYVGITRAKDFYI
jgi:DNA helicase-2/ATP-dependent DNA helicase PcrA